MNIGCFFFLFEYISKYLGTLIPHADAVELAVLINASIYQYFVDADSKGSGESAR